MNSEKRLQTLLFTTMAGYLVEIVQKTKMSTITELLEYLSKQMAEYSKNLEE